jgi:hypothetical protein
MMDDDDPYDVASDAADDDRYNYFRDQIVEQDGAEIRDEVEREELLAEIADAYETERTEADHAIAKAQQRLREGEYAESIFHAARGFDQFINEVFVTPIREHLLYKFRQLLPNTGESDILKEVNGVVGGARFASYAIAAAMNNADDSKKALAAFESFIGNREKYGIWQERNAVFHTTAASDAGRAGAFIATASDVISAISAPLRQRSDEASGKLKIEDFAPVRIYVLKKLSARFVIDQSAGANASDWNDIPESLSRGEVQEDLRRLSARGFARHHGAYFDEQWTLTGRGFGYWKREIEPNLPIPADRDEPFGRTM